MPTLRTALVLALLVALAFGLIRLLDANSVAVATAIKLNPAPTPSSVANRVLLPDLAPGACTSLAPSRAVSGQAVFIDAGHGGLDPGVVAGGGKVMEKDATLAVASRLSELLRAAGYRVVMARTQDTTVIKLGASDSIYGSLTASAEHRDLAARAACANAAGAAALVSIHFDAFNDPGVGGTETFYDPARTFAAANRTLATDLQSALVAALGTADRGVWTDDQLAAPTLTSSGTSYNHLIELGPMSAGWVDNPSQMAGALVEPLFLTNPKEARLAGDPAGQQLIASALEAGIVKYLTTG